jgi:thiol-disulfide isomerase/thioredoxin
MHSSKTHLCRCSELSHRIRWIFWGAAMLMVALVGWTSLPATESQPAAGALAPSWKLQDLNGKTVSSTELKGKVIVLDFWATWCPPCKAEIPGFIELQKGYGKDGLVIIGASVDDAGKIATVKKFVQKFGVNYPVVLANEETVRAFGGVNAIPTTFVINQEGRIVSRNLGFTETAELEKEIKALLHSSK